jgi:methyl-accepting chemotaxis protein
MLEEQMAMIEQSTSSVTEMIASISNVSEITGKKKTATDELVRTAGTGGERLNETIRIIKEITANIDEIRGTASIIQSVAAQTSLLAMNAAIEAAHAGEYGAGFSVVAEEIRKLAEASGTSSKRISGVIKEVVGSIEKAAASGDDTRRAFTDINTEVIDVAGALDEISSSMDELSAGGRQILDAMTSLRGYASDVQDGGNAMNDASVSLKEAFRIVESVASGVLSQIGGIGTRIDEISDAVDVVAEISGRLSNESELLEAEVSLYDLSGVSAIDDPAD